MSSSLADILEQTPRRQVEFDLGRVNIGELTLLELLDASDAAGIDPEEFREAFSSNATQARLFYAIAWVIMRRVEPGLTYADACEWDLLPIGEFDAAAEARVTERAKKVVAVAQIAKVTPEQAKSLTIAEVEAATELQTMRNRAARRKSRA